MYLLESSATCYLSYHVTIVPVPVPVPSSTTVISTATGKLDIVSVTLPHAY